MDNNTTFISINQIDPEMVDIIFNADVTKELYAINTYQSNNSEGLKASLNLCRTPKGLMILYNEKQTTFDQFGIHRHKQYAWCCFLNPELRYWININKDNWQQHVCTATIVIKNTQDGDLFMDSIITPPTIAHQNNGIDNIVNNNIANNVSNNSISNNDVDNSSDNNSDISNNSDNNNVNNSKHNNITDNSDETTPKHIVYLGLQTHNNEQKNNTYTFELPTTEQQLIEYLTPILPPIDNNTKWQATPAIHINNNLDPTGIEIKKSNDTRIICSLSNQNNNDGENNINENNDSENNDSENNNTLYFTFLADNWREMLLSNPYIYCEQQSKDKN